MADEQRNEERAISGDDIISEILRNSEAGAFKIRYTTLVPSIYHVYLHPADYTTIRPVIPALTAETRSALIDRLEELERSSRPSAIARKLGFDPEKRAEYKILDPDWTIEFHADAEEKLDRGEIEIYSELASEATPEFDGAMTRHVTRRRPEAANTTAPATATLAPTAATSFGFLKYSAPAGPPQSFAITKNQIVIGRGGKSFWVDLKLEAPPDVSREHCRIRRDESGTFYIKDVSQYGTSIDGKKVPSSIEGSGEQQRDRNVEVPLPRKCRITLADVFDLQFETADR